MTSFNRVQLPQNERFWENLEENQVANDCRLRNVAARSRIPWANATNGNRILMMEKYAQAVNKYENGRQGR